MTPKSKRNIKRGQVQRQALAASANRALLVAGQPVRGPLLAHNTPLLAASAVLTLLEQRLQEPASLHTSGSSRLSPLALRRAGLTRPQIQALDALLGTDQISRRQLGEYVEVSTSREVGVVWTELERLATDRWERTRLRQDVGQPFIPSPRTASTPDSSLASAPGSRSTAQTRTEAA